MTRNSSQETCAIPSMFDVSELNPVRSGCEYARQPANSDFLWKFHHEAINRTLIGMNHRSPPNISMELDLSRPNLISVILPTAWV